MTDSKAQGHPTRATTGSGCAHQAAHHQLEQLYTLRELQVAGYGDRVTLTKRIHEGRIPAVLVHGGYKIRESDLDTIAVPVIPNTDTTAA